MNIFKDKVSIITGGASGIGRSICEELGRRGAIVIVADINMESAEQVAASITQTGGRAYAAKVDVNYKNEIQDMIDDAIARHERLDYMFNNAGIAVIGDERDMTFELWKRSLDINLMGVLHGTRYAYSKMVKQGSGHIVNTSSIAGIIPFPIEASYTTSKYAVVGLSTALRYEGAALGVRISVVCPGPIMTGIYNSATILNFSMNDIFSKMPPRMMGPDTAAKIILRGVARNRAIIVFPFFFRIMWWLYRIHPALLNPFGKIVVRFYRGLRHKA
jgi:NAD(P)-dependent dehydrogenase (short-subunit alcohol dehydrogenase family)